MIELVRTASRDGPQERLAYGPQTFACSFLRSAQGEGHPKAVAGLIEIPGGDKDARGASCGFRTGALSLRRGWQL